MVVRVREALTGDSFVVATQAGFAPQLDAPAPALWRDSWVVTEPAAFALGTWRPSLRELTLVVQNAGGAPTVLTSVEVDADWVQAPPLEGPIGLQAGEEPFSLVLPLLPSALVPGKLTGSIRISGPGWERLISAELFVPLEPQAWWGEPFYPLATHVEQHTVQMSCEDPGAKVTGQIHFLGRPVEPPEQPVLKGRQWEWSAELLAGEYACDMIAHSKALAVQVPAPHRWSWYGPGKGRLLVGPGTCRVTVRNIGADPVDLRAEVDAPWAEVEPSRLQLQPGAEAVLHVFDRLTFLEQGTAIASLRLVKVGEQQVWSAVAIERHISGEMALPMVVEPELTIRSAGARSGSAQLRIRNVGGRALRTQVFAPPELHLTPACPEQVVIPPGRELVWGVTPVSPQITGHVNLRVESETAYPTLRSVTVPVSVQQIALLNDPPDLDFATVHYLQARQRRLRLTRSDGGRVSAVPDIPAEAQEWLSMESGYLTVRNVMQQIRSVETVVTFEDQISGAVLLLPVRANLVRPSLGELRPVKIKARPGQMVQRIISLQDRGEGLIMDNVITSNPRWMKSIKAPKRLTLEITVPRRPSVMPQWIRIFTNDPVQPMVQVPVEIEIRLSLLDRLKFWSEGRERLLQIVLWSLLALLLAVAVGIGGALWYHKTRAPQGGDSAWHGRSVGVTASRGLNPKL